VSRVGALGPVVWGLDGGCRMVAPLTRPGVSVTCKGVCGLGLPHLLRGARLHGVPALDEGPS
jgi:hypothetical protein